MPSCPVFKNYNIGNEGYKTIFLRRVTFKMKFIHTRSYGNVSYFQKYQLSVSKTVIYFTLFPFIFLKCCVLFCLTFFLGAFLFFNDREFYCVVKQ